MECYDTEGGKVESSGIDNQPKVSIVILGYNRVHMLQKCIKSLKEQDYKNTEIILVDNASTDNSVDVAKSYGIKKIIQLKSNKGFGPANNEGVKIAEGDFVLFVNNDMYLENNCISELVKEITKDPKIFAVDALQYDWEGTSVIHGAQKIKKSGIKNWFPFVSVDYFDTSEKIEIPWGCAGSLMVRRKMFNELGGFDDTFFMDAEDLDLCWRAWMMGWKTIYVPHAKVYHKVFGGRKDTPDWRRLSGEKNFLRFVIKVMSKKMILKIYLAKLLQAVGFMLMGRFNRGIIILKAIVYNILNLSKILEERKKILSSSKLNSEELFKKFLYRNNLQTNTPHKSNPNKNYEFKN